MAFEGNFSVAQISEGTIQLTDTSTGTDASLISRRIYLYKYDNTTIVPEGTTTPYIVWNISDSSITLTDILPRDVDLNITVEWLSSNPDPDGTYSKNASYCFKDYGEQFLYGKISQMNVAVPKIINDNEFLMNLFKMRLFLDCAEEANSKAADVMNAQLCLDLETYMIQNETLFF